MKPKFPRAAARRTATDARISAAVTEIIRRDGIRGVTIDAVSARSGVAKTTIYRRYTDRADLLADVLNRLAPIPDSSEAHLTKEGLAGLLREMQHAFEEHVGLAYVGQVLASDEEILSQWREKVTSPWLDALRLYVSRGTTEGVFSSDVNYDLIIDMIVGGMVICDARRGDVPADWADAVVDTIWPLIRQPS